MERAPHIERPIQRVLGAFEIANAHADLPKRGKRHAEAVRRARLLLEIHTSFGEGQRLLVPMLHQRDVRLVPAYRGQHVTRFNNDRKTFRLAERGDRFVQSALLRPGHARQGMHHREMASIAGGMQGRGGLGDVLPHDGHIADMAITEAQLVMCESDGPRIVGTLGLRQRLGEERNAAGGFAARNGQAAVYPPDVRKPRRIQPFAPCGRRAQRLRRPAHIVLKQPGFGKPTPHLNLFVAVQAGLAKRPNQEGGGLSPHSALQRLNRLSVEVRR